jgi:hypothetical protein
MRRDGPVGRVASGGPWLEDERGGLCGREDEMLRERPRSREGGVGVGGRGGRAERWERVGDQKPEAGRRGLWPNPVQDQREREQRVVGLVLRMIIAKAEADFDFDFDFNLGSRPSIYRSGLVLLLVSHRLERRQNRVACCILLHIRRTEELLPTAATLSAGRRDPLLSTANRHSRSGRPHRSLPLAHVVVNTDGESESPSPSPALRPSPRTGWWSMIEAAP